MKKDKEKELKQPKKGSNKVLFIVLGVVIAIVILFIGAGLVMRITLNNKVSESAIVDEIEEVNEEKETEKQEIEQPIIEESGSSTKEVEENNEPVDEIVLYDYENKLIGLKFNYATDMYIKENTDVVFNTLKSISQEGQNFKINKDKLIEKLNILQLTTGEEDGLLITVGLHPLEIIDKSKEKVENQEIVIEEIVESEITTEDLQEFDRVLKEEITKSGAEIIAFENSYIKEVNNLQAIITERKYSGSAETKTGVVDVIQGIVPVGVNAVVITAITDGSPIEKDKVLLFNEIIESLIVETFKEVETPVAPSEEPASVEESVPAVEPTRP